MSISMTCKKTGKYIYQVSSSSLSFILQKNRPEKFRFIARQNYIVLAVWWFVKYYFAPNFPIFRKSQTEEDGGNRKMQSALLLKQMQQNKEIYLNITNKLNTIQFVVTFNLISWFILILWLYRKSPLRMSKANAAHSPIRSLRNFLLYSSADS